KSDRRGGDAQPRFHSLPPQFDTVRARIFTHVAASSADRHTVTCELSIDQTCGIRAAEKRDFVFVADFADANCLITDSDRGTVRDRVNKGDEEVPCGRGFEYDL